MKCKHFILVCGIQLSVRLMKNIILELHLLLCYPARARAKVLLSVKKV